MLGLPALILCEDSLQDLHSLIHWSLVFYSRVKVMTQGKGKDPRSPPGTPYLEKKLSRHEFFLSRHELLLSRHEFFLSRHELFFSSGEENYVKYATSKHHHR